MNGSSPNYPSHLIVSGYEWQPQVWVVIHPNTISIKGPLADLLDYISSGTNISYSLIPPKEEQSGVYEGSGKWTGMMGMLHRKEADMSVTPLLMTEERIQTVAFTFPVFIGSIKILLGRPGKNLAPFNFFAVFSIQVWILFVIFFFTVIFLITISRRVSRDHPQSWSNEIWDTFVRTMNQDCQTPVCSTSTRLVVVFWSVLIMILMNLCGGQMKSLLTLAIPPDFIEDINDFVRFPNVQPILHRGSNEVDYFKGSKSDPQATIWRRIQRDPERSMVIGSDLYSPSSLDQIEQCKRAVFQEWRVFKGSLTNRLKEKGSCRFYISPPYRIIPVGVGFRKDVSPIFLEQVNLRILFMLQGNLIDYLYPPVRDNYQRCLIDSENVVTALTWHEVVSSLYVWLLGVATALASLLMEKVLRTLNLVGRKSKRKSRERIKTYSSKIRKHRIVHTVFNTKTDQLGRVV